MQHVKGLEQRVERLERVLADRDRRIKFLEKGLAKFRGGEAMITTKVLPISIWKCTEIRNSARGAFISAKRIAF